MEQVACVAGSSLCDDCGRLYPDQKSLKYHRRIHVVEPVICDVCLKAFKNKTILTAHIRLQHVTYDVRCPICNEHFSDPRHFSRHKKVHAEKKHKCNKCDRLFARTDYLKKHDKICNIKVGLPSQTQTPEKKTYFVIC